MIDLLRAVIGGGPSTILIVFGLALIAIGLFGYIPGSIHLNKVTRFAAVIVGTLALAGGLWMGRADSIVKSVKVLAPSTSITQECPFEVKISGIIGGNGPGTVAYQFQFSDGNSPGTSELKFESAGTRTVEYTSKLKTNNNFTVTLIVWSGDKIMTDTTPVISATCTTTPPPPPPPPPTPQFVQCPIKPRTDQQPGRGVNCKTINNRTTEPIVRLICADAELAELDGQLFKILQAKLDGAKDKGAIMQNQIRWNISRNETCHIPHHGDQSASELAHTKCCLLRMMKERFAEQSQ